MSIFTYLHIGHNFTFTLKNHLLILLPCSTISFYNTSPACGSTFSWEELICPVSGLISVGSPEWGSCIHIYCFLPDLRHTVLLFWWLLLFLTYLKNSNNKSTLLRNVVNICKIFAGPGTEKHLRSMRQSNCSLFFHISQLWKYNFIFYWLWFNPGNCFYSFDCLIWHSIFLPRFQF